MSAKSKESDAKAIVSFNSDSEDDDISSSSRHSLSASSEDDSDVETVTFRVPLLSQSKGKPAESASVADRKESRADESKNREQELTRRTEADEIGTSTKSRLSNKTELALEDDLSSKKMTNSNADSSWDELKVAGAKITNTERAISPTIIINDVEGAEVENDVTKSDHVTRKTPGDQPKKTTCYESSEGDRSYSMSTSKDLSQSKGADSPQNPGSDIEIEFSRPVKKSSNAIDTFDSDEKSSEDSKLRKTPEESEVERSSSFKITSDERAKSPKRSSERKHNSRAKSPKKTSENIDADRERSPKKMSEEKAVRREKSPKNSTKVGEESKRKSSKEAAKALDELIRSIESPEKSPTRNKSGISQETDTPEETKTKVKKAKKTKNRKHEDGDVADRADVELGSRKFDELRELIKTKDPCYFQDNVMAEDARKDHTSDLSKYKLNSGRLASEAGHDRLDVNEEEILGETKKPRSSDSSKPVKSGNDFDNLAANDIGNTGSVIPEAKKTSRKTEGGSSGTGNDSSSDHLRANEQSKELVNEESEFTYRRKSMDDFIKRILAEAREEKLKQKQGAKRETTTDQDRQTDAHGDIDAPREALGKTPGRCGGSTVDREASNLDRRLASIEKRRFGGNDSEKEANSKDEDGDRTANTKAIPNGVNDFDMNLDDDLAEINRFLQSRKSAAARFSYDDEATKNDSTLGSTPGDKRRWLADGEASELREMANADEGIPSPGSKLGPKKDYWVDPGNCDNQVLARIRRERESMMPETEFTPRRRNETDEVVRERTRNVRVVVDQQVELVQSMRNTSKNLDELEREIREVRQVCLDRQAKIQALEGALGAEYRTLENSQLTASDLQRSADVSLKEDFGRLRRQGKPSGESLDDDLLPFRRRSASVASAGSFSSTFGPSRSSDLGSDLSDLRPPSGLRQQRGSDLRRPEVEPEHHEIDRRRAGSVGGDRGDDFNPFGPDDSTKLLLRQRLGRSRASIATSNPTVDYTGNDSGDSFLSKIRAKYSFLAPSVDSPVYLGSIRSQGLSNYGASILSSSSDFKYGRPARSSFDDAKPRTKDLVTSSISASSYGSMATGGYTPGYYPFRDGKISSCGVGGFAGGTAERMRRAQSVTEFSFDRPVALPARPTGSGSSASAGGGEFHSRFLDKVRGKKATGEEAETPKGQDSKPFKSRFLRTSSFDSASSRSDRRTNGGLEDESSGRSEVSADA